MTETDLALLRTFYDAYGDYFGAEPEPFDGTALDAADRATLAGIRAAIAMPCEAPRPKGSGPSGPASAGRQASPARLWEIPYTRSRQSNKPGREM